MNINFNPVDLSRKETSVRVIVTHKGKIYRRTTGLVVESKMWSKAKQRSGVAKTDARIREIRAVLETTLDEKSTPLQIEDALDTALEKPKRVVEVKDEDVPTFWEYFTEWKDRESPTRRCRKLSYNNVVKLMGRRGNWEDIDRVYYNRLVKKMQDKGWSVNYQGTVVKHLKTVLHEGFKYGYHSSAEWQHFKKIQEDVDKIYLTAEEMERIWEWSGDEVMKGKARDLAWLGYLTCSRFSDYSRLTMDSIGADGKIRFSQRKTARAVVLPCSPRVREILERNGGKAPNICQQHFNEEIKNVCREVGICDKVEYSVSVGARHEMRTKEKWQLVSSHTFRRSAATNLYLQGVPLRSIMQLTGHSTIAMLEKYLKVGGEENADRLSDNPFFQ